MRLTCPKCEAEYEVPDDVIPASGRDVQCSNCGNTWFQPPLEYPLSESAGTAPPGAHRKDWPEDPVEDGDEANAPEADAPIPAAAFDPRPTGDSADDDLPPAAPPPPPGDMPRPEPGDDGADNATGDEAQPPQTNLPERPPRREIDPGVISVLRAEAEREQRARAMAQHAPETQPEPELSGELAESQRARAARLRRMARVQSEAAEPATGVEATSAATIPAARRSLYPAIDEINAATAQQPGPQARAPSVIPAAGMPPRQRGSFRSGLLLAVLIAVALLLPYLFAAQLADMLPPLSTLLADYAAWVDGLRQWLGNQIAALMLALDNIAAPADLSDSAES